MPIYPAILPFIWHGEELHETALDRGMAEGVGFEPTIRFWRIHTFQACAFDHSATPPAPVTPESQAIGDQRICPEGAEPIRAGRLSQQSRYFLLPQKLRLTLFFT